MPAVRLTTFGNYAISAALAESPKPPYHVDPIRVFTCIVVMICLVLAAFAFFYIFGRLHTFVQNKILDELDDVEVYCTVLSLAQSG